MGSSRDMEDLRTRKTRTAIQNAFIQLLCEMDFNEISIAMLMKRSGYSRGAFYLHYQNVWDIFEELTEAYVKALCAGFDVEKKEGRYTMDEQAFLITLEVVKATKRWYPFGKALLNKRRVPDIMPEMVERYAWERLSADSVLFPAVGVTYVKDQDEIARKTAMRYCVATLMSMFESAALYVTSKMTYQEMTRLAERIYAGNVAWWNYENHMSLHEVKWHEGLEK